MPGCEIQRHPRAMSAPSASTSWVAEEIERAEGLLDQGEVSEAVRLLAEAERGAVAQGYPELLPKIAALADEAGSRSEGRTQRKARRLAERIEWRARQPARSFSPARSEEPTRASQPARSVSPARSEVPTRASQPARSVSPARSEVPTRAVQPADRVGQLTLPTPRSPWHLFFGVVLIVLGVLLTLAGMFGALIAYAWGAYGWAFEMLLIYCGFAALAFWGGVRLARRR
jgi:hypothetical protein